MLKDPIAFEFLFASAKSSKSEHLNRQIVNVAKESSANDAAFSHYKLKLALLDSKAALWRARSPYLTISEVILSAEEAAALGLEAGQNASSSVHTAQAFANAWCSVFNKQVPFASFRAVSSSVCQMEQVGMEPGPPHRQQLHFYFFQKHPQQCGWLGWYPLCWVQVGGSWLWKAFLASALRSSKGDLL